MKVFLFLLASALVGTEGARVQKNTIGKVVGLLQGMLDKCKEDATADAEAYEAFKCYCDDNTEEKSTTIEDTTKDIGLLGNKIQGLQGSNGELSTECGKLRADMDANEAAREEAENMRKKEHEAFVAEEKDLTTAIATLGEAVDVLAAIGADQTMEQSAENEKFMAGYDESAASLLKLKTTVTKALTASRTFLTPASRKKVEAFMQAPFTGTYSAQSGAIVGILSEMKDTFESNLESAQAQEKTQKESFDKYMKVTMDEYDKMKSSYDDKQDDLGNNDGDLSTKREQLETATSSKADAEDFLDKLAPMCEDKASQYAKRKEFAANEEAALSKAIAILDNELSNEKFGKMDATTTGGTSFVQVSLLQRSRRSSNQGMASAAFIARQLRDVSRKHGSKRLLKAASLIMALGAAGRRAENPFTTVLGEIKKMEALIEAEAKLDKEQFDWCESERQTNNDDLDEKKDQISTLEGNIDEMDTAINDPATGLKKQISDTEETLETNHQSQIDETKARREENMVYQKAINNAASAEDILKQAIGVLTKYYDDLAKKTSEETLIDLQTRKEEPAPPDTFEGPFEGQSKKGREVITQLEFVMDESVKEAHNLHKDEQKAQHDFEDSMADLTKEEADEQENLTKLRSTLAEKQQDLESAREELDRTEKEKMALEHYLDKIKPGCDFINENYETRESNREEEKGALTNAVTLLKDTPAYKTAIANQKEEDMGDCKDTCLADEGHVDCKACLAGVSVPGYCAGHEGTSGC